MGGLKCIQALVYSVPLKEEASGGGWFGVRPPADGAEDWTIYQQANQTDLEHTKTWASDAG